MAGDGGAGGLRERKKRATRDALCDAALRLATERGIEHLTIEGISEAAGVSARTFFNYFSGKEEALLGDYLLLLLPGQERAGALITGAGSVLDGLYRVALAGAAAAESRREQVRARRRLMQRHPELVWHLFSRIAGFEQAIAAAVAQRVEATPDEAYPQLMAAVAVAAIRVAVSRWSSDGGCRPLADHCGEVFGLLSGGPPPLGGGHAGN